MRHSKAATTFVIVTALISAAPLAASAADKMGEAKDKTKSVTQDAKTGASDSWITSKTKIALFADDRVKGRQVHVETKDGVVYLRGKVDTPEAKAAAVEVTQKVQGVKSIKDDLQVVAEPARKAVEAKDSDIAKAVEARLSRDSELKKVEVRSDAGVVVLTGQVPTINASAKASEMARGVDGVRSVRNELTFTR